MTGLIGATGFVGSALQRQAQFDRHYSSSNIEQARGQRFDLLVCAAPSSGKWLANSDPQSDLASLEKLLSVLGSVTISRFVLISTIDVYPFAVGVDEDTEIDEAVLLPYGLHRRRLERHVAAAFERSLIVRLPAVFGRGLRKNVIFDLLHRDLRFVNPASVLQFYDIKRLWADLQVALDNDLSILNLAVEPLPVGAIASSIFNIDVPPSPGPAGQYDMLSRHSRFFGRQGSYLVDAAGVIEGLTTFRRHEIEGH